MTLINGSHSAIPISTIHPIFKVLLFILLNSWLFFLPIGYAFSSPNKGLPTDLSFGMSEKKEVTEGMPSHYTRVRIAFMWEGKYLN